MKIFSWRLLSVCALALWLTACAQTEPLREASFNPSKPLSPDEVETICKDQRATVVKVEYVTIPAELETVVETTRDTGHWGSEIVKVPAQYNLDGSVKTPAYTARYRDIHPFPVNHVERQVVKTPSYELKRTTMQDGTVQEEPLSDLCSKYKAGTLADHP